MEEVCSLGERVGFVVLKWSFSYPFGGWFLFFFLLTATVLLLFFWQDSF